MDIIAQITFQERQMKKVYLECAGSAALTRMPTSCEDLWLIGHTLNGFYDVKGEKMMESVYCDFTKLPEDPGKYNKIWRIN